MLSIDELFQSTNWLVGINYEIINFIQLINWIMLIVTTIY
jgi:hypothetical protein